MAVPLNVQGSDYIWLVFHRKYTVTDAKNCLQLTIDSR